MTLAIAVVTDGRDDYLGQTMAALDARAGGSIVERWILDDTGDQRHAGKLSAWYPHWTVLSSGRRLGFAGAIGHLWEWLAIHSNVDHVVHVEDDLVLTRPVDFDAMAGLLDDHPHLAQVALRRQAWNEAERTAGGVVEARATEYTDHADGQGREWLEHRIFFTTNTSVYRRALCTVGWPAGARSEGRFTHQLLTDGLPWGIPGPEVRFGYWGARTDEPLLHHIGDVRAGHGY